MSTHTHKSKTYPTEERLSSMGIYIAQYRETFPDDAFASNSWVYTIGDPAETRSITHSHNPPTVTCID